MSANAKMLSNWLRQLPSVILVVICAAALVSCAANAQPQSALAPNPNEPGRTMEVRITDEEGRPLDNATLHVSVWELEGRKDFPNKDYQSDGTGSVSVKLPRRLEIL